MYSDHNEIKSINTYKYNVQIEALYSFSGKTSWHDCLVFDLNEWGATLKIKQSLVKGDRVYIKLVCDNKEIVLTGEIQEASEPKYSVHFQKTTSQVRSIITRLITQVYNDKKNEIYKYSVRYN